MKQGRYRVVLSIGLGLYLVARAAAAQDQKPSAARVPTQQVTPTSARADGESPEAKATREWYAKLDGSSWDINVKPMSEEGTPQRDTLTFSGPQVMSKAFSIAGYAGSNFTLRAQGEDSATWETMQSKEGEGMVFWRGEVSGDTMRGVLSQRIGEGPAKDYSFNGTKVGQAAPKLPEPAAQKSAPSSAVTKPPAATGAAVSGAAAPTTRPAAAATPVAPAAHEKPKKKKGWFH